MSGLEVLEHAGVISRSVSAGDGRRKYLRLVRHRVTGFGIVGRSPRGEMLFVCSQNSARSQLAAAMWTERTGRPAASAGTRPAQRVHRGAQLAARRAGLSLADARPSLLGEVPSKAQVVTVCDVVHEELNAAADWWHWSTPDPVAGRDTAAFDAVVAELDDRIAAVMRAMNQGATK
jgi:ArsR family transcriptional regulator, arsenate/arsenite/antimonite-responsive transcriptional repressor / arsenate reductase (thioredoxin)